MNTQYKTVGLIVLVLLSTAIYLTLNQNIRIRVDPDKTTLYLLNENNRWIVAGREYNRLFDGSSIMNRRRTGIKISHNITDDSVKIVRTTPYIRGPVIVDEYYFDGAINNPELFPVRHKVTVINGSGYLYRYTVDELKISKKEKLAGETVLQFGRVKIELQEGYRWAWIGWPYGTDSVSAQYDIPTDYETFDVRLFDPVTGDCCLYLDGISSDRYYEYETKANISTNLTYISIWDDTARFINVSINGNYVLANGLDAYYKLDDNQTYNFSNLVGRNASFWSTAGDKTPGKFTWINSSWKSKREGNFNLECDTNPDSIYSINTHIWDCAGDHSNCSISLWLNASEFTNRALFGNGVSDGNFDFYIRAEKVGSVNKLVLNQYSGGLVTNVIDNITSGESYHFVMVKNTTNYLFYIDGVLNNTVSQDSTNGGELLLFQACLTGCTSPCTQMRLDEIAIWNRSIRGEEVSLLYNNGEGRYYDFLTRYNYTIDTLRYDNDDKIITDGTSYNITPDSRDEIYRAEFGIEGVGGPMNISLNYSGNFLYFPGMLYGQNLYQENFWYDNNLSTVHNLSLPASGVATVFVNFSTQGNLSSRVGYLNFTIIASGLDADNVFSNTYDFTEIENDTVVKLGTATYGSIDGTNQTYETFARNNGRWTNAGYQISASNCYTAELNGDIECVRNETVSTSLFSTYVDWDALYHVNFQVAGYVWCGDSVFYELTDGDNTVELFQVQDENCGFGGANPGVLQCNITMNRTADTTWVMDKDCYSGPTGRATVEVDTLDPPYYFRIRNGGVTTAVHQGILKNINYGGIYLNKTNTTFTGYEGTQSITGNYTTHILNITASDISRATLTANAFVPEDTAVAYYLSNDAGVTWESVVNGSSHLFTSSGNKLMARFVLNGTNESSPIVTRYQIEITSEAIDGLDIDVGADGDVDVEYDFELNSTSTPTSYLGNDSILNNYILTNCNQTQFCMIPIAFNFDSGGTLEISELNLTENINPVRLNLTAIDGLDTINITTHFDGGTSVNFSSVFVDYRGSKNITVSAHNDDHSQEVNWTIKAVYSIFNLTFPSLVEYWELFPKKRNESGIEPFGQNATDGIWRIFDLSYHDEGEDIYVRYNESIDTCVTENRFASWNFTYPEELMCYYPFDENNATDYSGKGNDGVSTRAMFGEVGRNGSYAVYFNGSPNTNVDTLVIPSENASYTVVAWINASFNSLGSNYNRNSYVYSFAFDPGTSGFKGGELYLVNSSKDAGVYRLNYVQGNGTEWRNTIFTTSRYFSFGKWYHVAVTYNFTDNITTLYVNSTVIDTMPSKGLRNNAYSIYIGSYRQASRASNITIDEFAFYNKTLTISEVEQIYNSSLDFYSGNNRSISTSPVKIVEGLGRYHPSDIWTYTDINCSGYPNMLIIPYFCYFSMCSTCVVTDDYADNCDGLV